MTAPSNTILGLVQLLQADTKTLAANTEKVIEAHGPTVQRATVAVGVGLGLVIVASILVLGAVGFVLTAVYLSLQTDVSSAEAAIWTGLITFATAGTAVAAALLIPSWMRSARARRKEIATTNGPADRRGDATADFQNQIRGLTAENAWTAVTMSFVGGFAVGLGEADNDTAARELGGSLAAALASGAHAGGAGIKEASNTDARTKPESTNEET